MHTNRTLDLLNNARRMDQDKAESGAGLPKVSKKDVGGLSALRVRFLALLDEIDRGSGTMNITLKNSPPKDRTSSKMTQIVT